MAQQEEKNIMFYELDNKINSDKALNIQLFTRNITSADNNIKIRTSNYIETKRSRQT